MCLMDTWNTACIAMATSIHTTMSTLMCRHGHMAGGGIRQGLVHSATGNSVISLVYVTCHLLHLLFPVLTAERAHVGSPRAFTRSGGDWSEG